MVHRCWRWSIQMVKKSFFIRVNNNWWFESSGKVMWNKIYLKRNSFFHDSTQAHSMIRLKQVVIQVMCKSWFKSKLAYIGGNFMIPLMLKLWFDSQIVWFKSRISYDLTHKLTQLLVPLCSIWFDLRDCVIQIVYLKS